MYLMIFGFVGASLAWKDENDFSLQVGNAFLKL